MAVTTDPLSIVPALGLERSARLACHLLASDLWTSGIPPAFVSVCLDLPPSLGDRELENVRERAMAAEWAKLDVAVVAGTHRPLPGQSDGTIIGAGDTDRARRRGSLRHAAMASPGDRVLVTKRLRDRSRRNCRASRFPNGWRRCSRRRSLARARSWIDQVSVVRGLYGADPDRRAGARRHRIARRDGRRRARRLLELATRVRDTTFGSCASAFRSTRSRSRRARRGAASIRTGRSAKGTSRRCARTSSRRRSPALAEAEIPVAEVGEVVRGTGVIWLTEPTIA
jgi:hypothetical protein